MFKEKMENYNKEKKDIVYLDESGFAHEMPRTHGYSEIGARCFGTCGWNAKSRENVLGALINFKLIACATCSDNIDSVIFNAWLKEILIPELPENSVIVMDNAAFHKSKETKDLIQNNGHIIEFLPPYSPDLNPIENKWAQIKSLRRKLQCDIIELFHFDSS